MGFPDMTVSICLTCYSSMFYNQTAGPLRPAMPFPHKTSQHVHSLELEKTLMNLLRARCHRSLVSTPSDPALSPLLLTSRDLYHIYIYIQSFCRRFYPKRLTIGEYM